MGWVRNPSGPWRGVALTLTVLALLVKVMVPPGFMLAEPGERAFITICTGHGPLILPIEHDGPKAPVQKKGDAPCMGAGNVSPPAPPTIAVLGAPPVFAGRITPQARTSDLTPGRGLAAPPPPSQGPPIQLS